MSELSNKKGKFIKRNFKQLSIEELSRKTGLKPSVIKVLIEKYDNERSIQNRLIFLKEYHAGFHLWQIILFTFLLFVVTANIIYSPCLNGPFVFDGIRSIQENPLIHITRISQLLDIFFSKEFGRRLALPVRIFPFLSGHELNGNMECFLMISLNG